MRKSHGARVGYAVRINHVTSMTSYSGKQLHLKQVTLEASYNSPLCGFTPSFTDSFPITGRIVSDSRFYMNPLMRPNGYITVDHVEEVLQPQMVSLLHHHTHTPTQAMQTVSTPSHSPLAQPLCWPFRAWTYIHIPGAIVMIIVVVITLRSEMAVQLLHLSLSSYVAMRYLLQSNPPRTKCGWSEDKHFAT